MEGDRLGLGWVMAGDTVLALALKLRLWHRRPDVTLLVHWQPAPKARK